jgi:hypothetical protein
MIGYSLVTITTAFMLATNEVPNRLRSSLDLLSDPGRKVQKDLDIAEYTDPEHDR